MQSLPSFLVFPKDAWIPRLKPRHVPLRSWALQVVVLTSGSLMNNWVFAFSVPLTIQIVFRSAGKSYPHRQCCVQYSRTQLGLAVSMVFGYLAMNKRYSLAQLVRFRDSCFAARRAYYCASGCSRICVHRSDTSDTVPTFVPQVHRRSDGRRKVHHRRRYAHVLALSHRHSRSAARAHLHQVRPTLERGCILHGELYSFTQLCVPSGALTCGVRVLSTAFRCPYSCSSSPISSAGSTASRSLRPSPPSRKTH